MILCIIGFVFGIPQFYAYLRKKTENLNELMVGYIYMYIHIHIHILYGEKNGKKCVNSINRPSLVDTFPEKKNCIKWCLHYENMFIIIL